jgi:hypothetical protein
VGRPGLLFLSRGKGVVQTGHARQLAQYLGYGTRARGAPVSSHGQAVFTNGRNYISIDFDSHNGGVWKMFDRHGEGIGTFDAMLTQIK